MDQLGLMRSQPAIEPVLSRRRLLRSAGLGLGVTALLQPTDAAARWLDIEFVFTNHSSTKRPLTIEVWSRDGGWGKDKLPIPRSAGSGAGAGGDGPGSNAPHWLGHGPLLTATAHCHRTAVVRVASRRHFGSPPGASQ